MALIGLIRRWHIRDQLSLREISRRLGISRNTVRRYIRSDITEPVYADRKSVSALDKYAFKLSTWLKTESTKSRKQKRSVKQMYLDLRALGYEGSYDRVAAFARQWKVDQLARVNSASKGTACNLPANFITILRLRGTWWLVAEICVARLLMIFKKAPLDKRIVYWNFLRILEYP